MQKPVSICNSANFKNQQNLKSRGFSGAPHAKLVQIGLSNHNAPQVLDPPDRRRIERRKIALEDAGATSGRHVRRTDVVLDGDEHSGERPDLLTAGDHLIEAMGLLQNGVFGDVEETFEMGLGEAKAGEVGFGELSCAEAAGEEGVADGEYLRVWGWRWWRGGGRGLGGEGA